MFYMFIMFFHAILAALRAECILLGSFRAWILASCIISDVDILWIGRIILKNTSPHTELIFFFSRRQCLCEVDSFMFRLTQLLDGACNSKIRLVYLLLFMNIGVGWAAALCSVTCCGYAVGVSSPNHPTDLVENQRIGIRLTRIALIFEVSWART